MRASLVVCPSVRPPIRAPQCGGTPRGAPPDPLDAVHLFDGTPNMRRRWIAGVARTEGRTFDRLKKDYSAARLPRDDHPITRGAPSVRRIRDAHCRPGEARTCWRPTSCNSRRAVTMRCRAWHESVKRRAADQRPPRSLGNQAQGPRTMGRRRHERGKCHPNRVRLDCSNAVLRKTGRRFALAIERRRAFEDSTRRLHRCVGGTMYIPTIRSSIAGLTSGEPRLERPPPALFLEGAITLAPWRTPGPQ